MKYKRIRIIVKDDSDSGWLMLYPSFKNNNEFEIKELSLEYQNNKNYKAYQITEAPENFKSFFDTKVFYTNKSNNYARVSNIYTCSCKDLIQKLLDKGDFSIITTNDGYKVIGLNYDPLDLNNYILNDNYDFIYEIANNSSDNISFANIVLDQESKILGLSNDYEIEPGKSVQLKYNLDILKKIYGEKNQLALDLKKTKDSQWIRDWKVNFEHKNDKYIVVVSDGTNGRPFDAFDLWKDFSDLEKGVIIY